MEPKDYFLILWPGRDIEGVIFSLIHKLTDKFKIIVVVIDVSSPPSLQINLKKMKENGFIQDYYITDKKANGIKKHLRMKNIVQALKQYEFRLSLCCSDMQIEEKYIYYNIYTDIRICLWTPITYLFMYQQQMAGKLLDANHVFEGENYRDERRGQLITKIILLLSQKSSFFVKVKNIFNKKSVIYGYFFGRTAKYINVLLNEYLYPFFINGKILRKTNIEKITQLSDGDASAYIFFDRLEVDAHKKLYNNDNVFLSYLEVSNNHSYENKILGILSGWESDHFLDEDVLDMYVRDFVLVYKRYKANIIDLRPHPDMDKNNNYALQLTKALQDKGIVCRVVKCNKPVTKESLNYSCVAGFASASLRDVRLFNELIDVVAFESISKKYFVNPKFAFGLSEGIDWINSEGKLIKSQKLNLKNRLPVDKIIINLVEKNQK